MFGDCQGIIEDEIGKEREDKCNIAGGREIWDELVEVEVFEEKDMGKDCSSNTTWRVV